ncbi:MAG: YceD family protein [Pseudomonadota bacterium]|nr:YceD family protein [Pseudomonadota bacterium]
MSPPEFSRTVRVDTLGQAPRTIAIEADEAEREGLARRFGFVAIDRLAAEVALARLGEAVTARGILSAEVAQSCVASGEPVAETVEEDFAVEFRPHPPFDAPDEEIELGEGELDVIFYDGAMIDLGEAVAETLSLSVEPYPRAAGAEEALKEASVRSEAEAGPFGDLAGLRDKLGQ